MSDTCTYDCSAHPTEISAYGDISGIGVTTGFFATAWMVVLLLLGYYLVAYNPELDPFRQPGEKTFCQHPNSIDYVFLHAVRKLPGLRSLQYSNWLQSTQLESALNKCVIMFADIQVFTGLAVMISGYIALSCGLQSYHWQLTVYLVWLASLTHLAALSFLRNYLANRPNQMIWRVIAMFIMMVLLAVAVGLAGYFSWDGGPSKPSDFAVCFFGEKMETRSVAFESMLKTLILLAYGFFIRLAKMSKPFEGGLRRVAARLSDKAMRLQYGDGENAPPRYPYLSSRPDDTYASRFMYFFRMAFFSLLSIHLSLLTSFLAEVYWLTLSALWVTRRYFKTRSLGPKEEDEWTFGQVLPVLLAVAPLAAILEHFSPGRASGEVRPQSPDQIGLLTLDRPDTDEAQDNILAGIDHRHIHSVEYRGAFLLAAAAYLGVGIFFVFDKSPGIKQPLIQLGVAFVVLDPLLQLLWIHCTLWISHIDRSSLAEKTTRGVVFGAFMSITVNEFLHALTEDNSKGNEPVYGTVASLVTIPFSLNLSLATGWQKETSQGQQPLWATWSPVVYPIMLVAVVLPAGIILHFGNPPPSPLMVVSTLGVCLCLEFAYFCFELFMEKMQIASKCAVYLRCALLFCILAVLVALRLTTSASPSTWILTTSIIASSSIWVLVDILVSIFRNRQTVAEDESATSTTSEEYQHSTAN